MVHDLPANLAACVLLFTHRLRVLRKELKPGASERADFSRDKHITQGIDWLTALVDSSRQDFALRLKPARVKKRGRGRWRTSLGENVWMYLCMSRLD